MDKTKQLETSLVIVLGLIAVYFFKHSDRWLVAALLTGLLSLLIPGVATAIHWGWTRLSLLLGAVTGKLLLTLVYVFLLLPLAGLSRMLRGSTTLRKKAGGDTFFTERNHVYKKEDLINPW